MGFRQGWVCAHCGTLLPATYEVDHVTALHNDGKDCIATNAEALCNHCHATKTLSERIEREKRRREAILKAKKDTMLDEAQLKPLQGNQPLLDPEPGPEFVANRFLKFAFVKPKP